jgi:lipopolysaccharide/colanic/teichoic acid biosynthesis glycosyltransferase
LIISNISSENIFSAILDIRLKEKHKQTKEKIMYLKIKRVIDVVLSSIALIFLAPLIALCMLLIFLEDGGNPIFKQERIGENGKPFVFYKLRTMRIGAEEERRTEDIQDKNESDGPVFKIKDDPRITRVGKFLRKASIDELPQLINILKNEMSIVGPRPALPCEVECYNDYQRQRLMCKPGLTCYWQTTPSRNDVPFDEWVEMDLKYIRNRSLKEDFMLMLKTFKIIFTLDSR